jgi:hypothetical protein
MKPIVKFLFFMILFQHVRADCAAPTIDLDVHEGLVHGFMVKTYDGDYNEKSPYYKLTQEESETLLRQKSEFIKVSSGTGWVSIEEKATDIKFQEINIDFPLIKKRIEGVLVPDEYDYQYYLKERELHNLPDKYLHVSYVRGFDLTGDEKADLLVFGVSPLSNVYTGVISIVNGKWFKLIDPICC